MTKTVVLNAESLPPAIKDPYGNLRTGTEAKAKINRKDFGLTYNSITEAGGLALGEDIKLIANIQVAREKNS